ncbi:hypothetical protein [Methylomonas sp. UP202]|uniref:hypothetical protein n=1 Tax=Methylomonas sp. UP202 TaxID=3040943 RepID=UPI002478E502|nr:hypothetical protein [Methylomonas sp. UP202]WGS85847.1 hypothetical protein QC632_22875 [Methylomonas sp. UP202]
MNKTRILWASGLLAILTIAIAWLLVPPEWDMSIEQLNQASPPSAGATIEPKTSDGAVYGKFLKDSLSFITPGIPPTGNYFLGRNYQWNGMFSPRWQLYSGKATRALLAAGRLADARKAFMAMKVGADSIGVDGSVPFQLPESMRGYTITPGIVAQAASFFLGESCLAVKALNQYPSETAVQVGSDAERKAVSAALARSLAWLESQDESLYNADLYAANRLLFDAVAYQACGSLFEDEFALNLVEGYLETALEKFDGTAGYFIEKSGWDTHYQAVAINQINELLMAGYDGVHTETLQADLKLAAQWLAARVGDDGVLHSDGNTRTCWSGETILGGDKLVDAREVWRALAYSGMRFKDDAMQSAANRLANWLRTKPTTTCVR